MDHPQPARVLSTSPFTYTRLPVLAIAGIAAIMAIAAGPDVNSILFLAVVAAVAYVAMRATAGSYADKVSDGGDHLVVRIGQEEERISLSNIESVESHRTRPPYIQLNLRYEGKFGREIAFIPAGIFADPGWTEAAVFHELEEKVRAAQK